MKPDKRKLKLTLENVHIEYNVWLKFGTQEKIYHFLLGSKLLAQSFQLHVAHFTAVNYTKDQILPLLDEQDQWCLKQLAQEKKDKEKKEKERELMDPDQALSDDASYDPLYIKPYNRNNYSQPEQQKFIQQMGKFVETFPFLLQLEGMIPSGKSKFKFICPCSAKIYNKSLWK